MNGTDDTLYDTLKSAVMSLGYEFVGYKLQRQGKYSLLRIYIDTEKGVSLDDCTKVSHQVSAVLDVEDPIAGHYTLEVSSPGIERPLFEIAHYQKYVGQRVKISMRMPINNQRNFVGVLLKVENENIHLLTDNNETVLPFADIEKAKVLAEIRP